MAALGPGHSGPESIIVRIDEPETKQEGIGGLGSSHSSAQDLQKLSVKPSMQKLLQISERERQIDLEAGNSKEYQEIISEFDFRNICYRIPRKKDTPQTILEGICGSFKRGELTALMGPSGSGKTSLLTVLAQRVSPKLVSGDLLINKTHRVDRSWKRKMGFVFQDDLMLANLTVRETLLFSARLRLPQSMPRGDKEAKVDALLDLLGLTRVAHQPIGGVERRGVSGGERKRAALGAELVTGPALLFLDEPTSGLDAAAALSLTLLLRALAADSGTIFVAAIHQPRSSVFNLFDQVVMLRRGRAAYVGPRAGLGPYLVAATQVGCPPADVAPADWALDLLADLGADADKLVEEWSSNRSPKEAPAAGDSIPLLARSSGSDGGGDEGEGRRRRRQRTRWATSGAHQFRVLLERQLKEGRGSALNKVSFIQCLAVSAIVCALWWQTNNVNDILGFLFFVTINQAFNVVQAMVKVFPAQRALLVRERGAGYYRVGAYFLARTLSDSLTSYIFPMLYALLCYTGTGVVSSAEDFFTYMALFFSVIMAAQAYGLLLSSMFREVQIATIVAFTSVLALLLIGGFYVENDRLPVGIRWLTNISFIYWGFTGMSVNVFSGKSFDCTMLETPDELGGGCPVSGDVILMERSIKDLSAGRGATLGNCFLALWVLTVGLRLLAFLVLRRAIKRSH